MTRTILGMACAIVAKKARATAAAGRARKESGCFDAIRGHIESVELK